MPTIITRGAGSARGFGSGGGGFSPSAPGQQAYTSPGIYSWVAPENVTSVCVVCVGGGSSSGGGGGLGWKNNIGVSPGNTYTVVVGGNGQDSYFINPSLVKGGGGSGTGGSYVGDGGGSGGNVGAYGAGGGAGGYSGNGGTPSGSYGGNPGHPP